MSEELGGELWPYFVPLWADLRNIAPEVKLAGGYGLFLKQQWLLSSADGLPPTLVPVQRWNEWRPRVTKDIDLVVEVNLIASPGEQERLQAALERHGFAVVPHNARWQFERELEGDRSVLVDFHSPPPGLDRDDIRVAARRVKPRPSLGPVGIHGRENAQAVCSDLNPFTFMMAGAEIVLSNPVTLALMKLAATGDQYQASRESAKTAGQRALADGQASKHATDLFRIAAMITREENDCIPSVLDVTRRTEAFEDAREIFAALFGKDDSWGTRVAAPMWRGEDNGLIRDTLSEWFR